MCGGPIGDLIDSATSAISNTVNSVLDNPTSLIVDAALISAGIPPVYAAAAGGAAGAATSGGNFEDILKGAAVGGAAAYVGGTAADASMGYGQIGAGAAGGAAAGATAAALTGGNIGQSLLGGGIIGATYTAVNGTQIKSLGGGNFADPQGNVVDTNGNLIIPADQVNIDYSTGDITPKQATTETAQAPTTQAETPATQGPQLTSLGGGNFADSQGNLTDTYGNIIIPADQINIDYSTGDISPKTQAQAQAPVAPEAAPVQTTQAQQVSNWIQNSMTPNGQGGYVSSSGDTWTPTDNGYTVTAPDGRYHTIDQNANPTSDWVDPRTQEQAATPPAQVAQPVQPTEVAQPAQSQTQLTNLGGGNFANSNGDVTDVYGNVIIPSSQVNIDYNTGDITPKQAQTAQTVSQPTQPTQPVQPTEVTQPTQPVQPTEVTQATQANPLAGHNVGWIVDTIEGTQYPYDKNTGETLGDKITYNGTEGQGTRYTPPAQVAQAATTPATNVVDIGGGNFMDNQGNITDNQGNITQPAVQPGPAVPQLANNENALPSNWQITGVKELGNGLYNSDYPPPNEVPPGQKLATVDEINNGTASINPNPDGTYTYTVPEESPATVVAPTVPTETAPAVVAPPTVSSEITPTNPTSVAPAMPSTAGPATVAPPATGPVSPVETTPALPTGLGSMEDWYKTHPQTPSVTTDNIPTIEITAPKLPPEETPSVVVPPSIVTGPSEPSTGPAPGTPVTEMPDITVTSPKEPLSPIVPVTIPPGSSTVTPVEVIQPGSSTVTPVDVTTPETPVVTPPVLVPPVVPNTPTTTDNTHAGTYKWGTVPKVNIPTGLNPGFIHPTAFYSNTTPSQAQFYWGSHPYQPGPTFNSQLYNTVPAAPTTPWGATNASVAATPAQVFAAMQGRYPLFGVTSAQVAGPVKP